MTLRAGVAAQLWLSLEVGVWDGEDESDVVVINEGHEGIVIKYCEHSLADQLDEACLIGDVVDWGVDGDDDLAQLAALLVKLWEQQTDAINKVIQNYSTYRYCTIKGNIIG